MTEPKTNTLEVPGAVLTYDIRTNGSGAKPVLIMIASPMGAAGFGTLSDYFTDRTVVTYDPRGAERSTLTDGAPESTPEVHADDLHKLIATLDAGSVDMFASSGGATNALALVAGHPEQVRTLVAHEPPLAQLLPDREEALAAIRDIDEIYQRDGLGPGMAKFIAIVMHKGPVPADFADQPAPDPSMFGLPTEDDGSRDDVLLGQNLVTNLQYQPDLVALSAASTSDHGGFLGGEYGQTGDPEAFASKLREVLDEG
ncbi:MAG: alpha/beta fold hydrolase [Acidimicrobiia bacterium]